MKLYQKMNFIFNQKSNRGGYKCSGNINQTIKYSQSSSRILGNSTKIWLFAVLTNRIRLIS